MRTDNKLLDAALDSLQDIFLESHQEAQNRLRFELWRGRYYEATGIEAAPRAAHMAPNVYKFPGEHK